MIKFFMAFKDLILIGCIMYLNGEMKIEFLRLGKMCLYF